MFELTKTRNRITFFVFLVFLLAGSLPVEGAEYTSRDTNVGHVIMSAIGKKIDTRKPGSHLMKTATTMCKGEDVYCYKSGGTYDVEGAEIPYNWNVRFEFNLPYKDFSEFPIPESWRNNKEKKKDEKTDGHIFYKERKSRKGGLRGRVVIKKYLNGVMMTLAETRPVRETKREMIDRALVRWHSMVAAAEKYGLFDKFKLRIVAQSGIRAGKTLANGEVVQIFTDFDNPDDFTIEIHGRPPGLKADEKHEINIEIPHRQKHVITLSGPGVYEAERGYRIETTENSTPVTFKFKSKELKQYKQSPIGHMKPAFKAEVSSQDQKQTLFFQPGEWEFIISRFELFSEDARWSFKYDRYEEEIEEEEIEEEEGEKKSKEIRDWYLADYLEYQGDTLDTWNGLKKMVKAGRTFAPGDEVVMGWKKDFQDDEGGFGFYLAKYDPKKDKKIPAFVSKSHLKAEFDLEILREPIVQAEEDRTMDGEYETSEDEKINWVEEQQKIWREFEVEDFSFTLHRVDHVGPKENIYLPAGEELKRPEETHYSYKLNWGDKRELTNFANLPELHHTTDEIIFREKTAPIYRFGPLHKAKGGIYELRLYIKLQQIVNTDQSESNKNKYREQNVAIRFKVIDPVFIEKEIHSDQERKKKKEDPQEEFQN
jgi:hypothetical protein